MSKFTVVPDRRNIGGIWLIILSDITTNLMLFFLMLFSMTRMTASDKRLAVEGMESSIINEAARERAEQERKAKKKMEEEAIERLRKAVDQGRLAGKAAITVNQNFLRITLNPDSFFSIGSASLNPDTVNSLESIVGLIKGFPGDIIIEGHTDNIPVKGGAYHSNWELSVARAVSVVRFFSANGVDPRQLIAAGYGEFHPAYPNDTEINRARNRRIEIAVALQPGSNL